MDANRNDCQVHSKYGYLTTMENYIQCFCYVSVILLSLGYSLSNGEKKSWGTASLDYCNPMYTANCSVITFHTGQRSLTNITVNFLVPMGNNITIGATAESSPEDKVKVDYKFCVLFRQPWLLSFLQRQEMKLPYPCPYPAGKLFLSNLSMPPSNLPLPLKRGRYKLILEMFRRNNQERILAIIIEGEIIKNSKRKN